MRRKGSADYDDLYSSTFEGDDADDAISLADFFPTRHANVHRAGLAAEWLA
jgi:hypothetical protein